MCKQLTTVDATVKAEPEEAPVSANNPRCCRHCGESFQYLSWLTRHYTKCPELEAGEAARPAAAASRVCEVCGVAIRHKYGSNRFCGATVRGRPGV